MSVPEPQQRPRDVGLLVFLGAVVLVVAGSLVATAALTTGSRSPASRAAAAARQFLEAVAAGDSAKALSSAAQPPTDTSMLTDEVLRANQRAAPIEAVTVLPGSTERRVEVAYTVGGELSGDTYFVTRTEDGDKLDRITGTVTFVTAGVDRLPLLANGVRVQTSTAELFPGRYALTTGLPNVDWGDDTEASVWIGRTNNAPGLQPRVTGAGRRAFLAGARKIVGDCTARRELNPTPGCPFGLRQPTAGPKVPDATVRWRLDGDPWQALGDPQISAFTDPGVAKARTSMTFVCTCRYSTGEACPPQRVTSTVTFAGDVTGREMSVRFAAY